MIVVHGYAHRLQFCAKIFSDLEIMEDFEELLKVTHGYFAHSPKHAVEFYMLAFMKETKRNKLLKIYQNSVDFLVATDATSYCGISIYHGKIMRRAKRQETL